MQTTKIYTQRNDSLLATTPIQVRFYHSYGYKKWSFRNEDCYYAPYLNLESFTCVILLISCNKSWSSCGCLYKKHVVIRCLLSIEVDMFFALSLYFFKKPVATSCDFPFSAMITISISFQVFLLNVASWGWIRKNLKRKQNKWHKQQ